MAESNGVIRDQSVENLLVLWIVAVAWNAATCVYAIPPLLHGIRTHNKSELVYLVAPAAGLILLGWALRRTMRIRKFGDSLLRLKTCPVPPGGELSGFIHVSRAIDRRGPVDLRLLCVEQLMPGNRRGVREKIIWQEARSVSDVPPSASGTEIPVTFHLPPDVAPSRDWDPSCVVLWRLEARCKAAGVDYFSRFEVLVSAVTQTQPVTAAIPVHVTPHGKWNEPGIICEPLAGSGLRIQIAAGRNKGRAMFPTIAGLIFTGIAVILAMVDVPAIMRMFLWAGAAFCLFVGGVLLYIAIYMWFVRCDITARRGSITVKSVALLFRRERTFAAADISEIISKKEGESQINGKDTVYYGVLMKTRGGKETWLSSGVKQQDYTDWMAEEIRNAVGTVGGERAA